MTETAQPLWLIACHYNPFTGREVPVARYQLDAFEVWYRERAVGLREVPDMPGMVEPVNEVVPTWGLTARWEWGDARLCGPEIRCYMVNGADVIRLILPGNEPAPGAIVVASVTIAEAA